MEFSQPDGVKAEVFGELDLVEDFAVPVGGVLAGEAGIW